MLEEELFCFFKNDYSDESFLSSLEGHRGHGRNDYSIEVLWKGLLAYVSSRETSVEEIRLKMKNFPEIFPKIPSSYSFSRFISFMGKFSSEIEELLFRKMGSADHEFGRVIAIGSIERLHFIFEPKSCIPLLFSFAESNESNAQVAEKLLSRLHSGFFKRVKYLLGNSSYEGLEKIAWDRFKIRAIVPSTATSQAFYLYKEAQYDEAGRVYCATEGQPKQMVYAGFEKKRNTLKYRCMAQHYGTSCEKLATCPLRKGIRIPISLNEKIFTSLPRTSYRWGQIFTLYSALEPVSKLIQPYIQMANQDLKKLLYCRIAALVFFLNAPVCDRRLYGL